MNIGLTITHMDTQGRESDAKLLFYDQFSC